MARRTLARRDPALAGDLPVRERTLANGLKALVLPRPGATTVVCDLFHPVGSANEPPGQSGLAHFLEHMLFKGTRRFPKGQLDRLAFLAAGQANAETGEDDTHFWFSLPADRWELALVIEADRLAGAVFDPAEVDAERQVIVEERARELDSPLGRLDQAHRAARFVAHPYRHPILGSAEDLRRLSAADLTRFYREHYRPDGAVLVVVGAVDPARVLDRVEETFGGLRRGRGPRPSLGGPARPRRYRREVRIEEPTVGLVRGLMGWTSVPLGHDDGPALDVLADLLACGRRSRLWSTLVDQKRIASWVDASHEPGRLAGQFLVQVEALPGVEPEVLGEAVREVVGRLAAQGPTAEELARVRTRLEVAWRWGQEDLAGLAVGLGQVALWDDWRAWPREHRSSLAVTADDARRVASRYLVEDGLTLAWSVPAPATTNGHVPLRRPTRRSRGEVDTAEAAPTSLLVPKSSPIVPDFRPRRFVMANGLRVLMDPRPGTGTVALELYHDSGQVREEKPGLAHLVGRLREEGTRTRSAEDLAAAVEDIGGSLEIGATGLGLRVRAEDLAQAVELMTDVTLRPAFPADALEWTRQRVLADMKSDRDDPAFRADLIFRGLIYGEHPYGRDPRGRMRGLGTLTLDDVRAHHRAFVRPNNACLAVSGDFGPRHLRSILERHLAEWASGPVVFPPVPTPSRGTMPRCRRVRARGQQVQVLIGHLGVRRDDPDFGALCVLDHVLGTGPGFSDRLSRVLRDEMGLAYSVGGGMTDSADIEPGLFQIYVGTGPEEADRAIAAVHDQVRALAAGEFADDEVEAARQYLAGAWVFEYESVSQRAERLVDLERWGLPLDDPLGWPRRLARLTPDDVRRAAQRHINPSALVCVEYGPLPERLGGR
jgi:zinc protease